MASDSDNEWRPSIILALLPGHDSAFGCLSHSCWFWPSGIWTLLIPSWDYLLSMLLISITTHGEDNVICSSPEASFVILDQVTSIIWNDFIFLYILITSSKTLFHCETTFPVQGLGLQHNFLWDAIHFAEVTAHCGGGVFVHYLNLIDNGYMNSMLDLTDVGKTSSYICSSFNWVLFSEHVMVRFNCYLVRI